VFGFAVLSQIFGLEGGLQSEAWSACMANRSDHDRRFLPAKHRKERRDWLTLFPGSAHINQQLAKHDNRRGGVALGHKPNFFGLNINQAFVDAFQAKRRNVLVFYIFFGFGGG
jgi:hypothetical protein